MNNLISPRSPVPAGEPFFDFQVQRAARFVDTDSAMPYPDSTLDQLAPFPSDFVLAQYVVDSTGTPVASTLKLLAHPAAVTKDSVSDAIRGWRRDAL